MEIVIIVFFLAIFGGIVFLLGLSWFIFRRVRRSRSAGRNFSSNPNFGSDTAHNNFTNTDNSSMMYAAGSLYDNRDSDNQVATETAYDSPQQTDNSYSHESHGAFAAPVETSYTESSYSSYDSGSSYDSSSSSSYDSGSSSDSGSSDSGSSSSSSSD